MNSNSNKMLPRSFFNCGGAFRAIYNEEWQCQPVDIGTCVP